jgi:DinB superfamily
MSGGIAPTRVFDFEEGLAVLERTPGTLRALLAGLPETWLEVDEGPDTWSPRQVVAHLIVGEETDWIPRARRILEHGRARPFEPFDRFRHLREFGGTPLPELLDRFERLRGENLVALRELGIDRATLAREGAHPDFGAVTLEQLLATWVAHDLGHLVQIARTMARRYREAVGPWTVYLSVMDAR